MSALEAMVVVLPILHPSTEKASPVPAPLAPSPRWQARSGTRPEARTSARPVAETIRADQVAGIKANVGGNEANAFIVDSCAETPNPDEEPVPTGYSLPPARDGDLPTISGVPPELVFTAPEREVARIRFWLPQDALTLAQRALDHARRTAKDPLQPTWVYFEQILVHFIRTIDNPVARAADRRHPIIMRDGFWCIVPGCMCRGNLDSHHFKLRSECGPDTAWNQGGGCHWDHDLGSTREGS